MTSQAGSIVWWAVYSPFGAVHATGGTPRQNMRFPGQWFQLEMGLAYNWHRNYDATLGRYVQPDPLGYDGGRNLYGYVGGNPSAYSDPTGLCPACIIPVLGAYGALLGTRALVDSLQQPPAPHKPFTNDNADGEKGGYHLDIVGSNGRVSETGWRIRHTRNP